MIDDLKMIKKFYGEKMMHLCRKFFPTLLDKPGQLYELLDMNFQHSRNLYYDICDSKLELEFKDYIYTLVDKKRSAKTFENRTPKELLDAAGYTLYECHSEEDIRFFKKYYKPSEELCTFWGDRLDRCYVFFAIKKNVHEIIRENFSIPQRQDEYGTSVISIQFTKGKVNTLSIKNRYNHTVINPDNTFNNNLDDIISGLSDSFSFHYGLNFNTSIHNFELNGYVKANDGKFYKYNYEINNIYYCPNNIIINNFEVKEDYNNCAAYLIIDYFVLDIPNKKIHLYDTNISDSFIDGIKNITKIQVLKKDTESKVIYIETRDNEVSSIIEIIVDNNNKITGYKNDRLDKIGDNFLKMNNSLTNLNLPVLKQIGDNFLYDNNKMTELNLPLLENAGDSFLTNNVLLATLNLPLLKITGDDFLKNNNSLTEVSLPSLRKVRFCFLNKNEIIIKLSLPLLEQVGPYFLYNNKNLEELSLPSLKKVEDGFLTLNNSLVELNLPLLENAGDYFLSYNISLTKLSSPLLEQVGHYFLYYNKALSELSLPSLKKVGTFFLCENESMTKLNLPLLEQFGDEFLKNTSLKEEFLRRNL